MIRFSIITPSFNMLHYLKRCSASVNDQQGVHKEHIIVDGGSKDGTVDWLKNNFKSGKYIIESDSGMYDAINKGIECSSGDLIAYLNCDEQYLPNSLRIIDDYSLKYPNADVYHGNMLVIDDNGKLISFKKSLNARFNYLKYGSSYIYSCATFFRRNLFEKYKFNSQLKSLGDIDLYLKLLSAGKNFIHINEYISVFTKTGNNLSSNAMFMEEYKLIPLSSYGKSYFTSNLYDLLKKIEKLKKGAYFQEFPLRYQIYLDPMAIKRETIEAKEAASF